MRLRRTLRWRALEGPGLEHLEIAEWDDGTFHVRSTLVAPPDGRARGLYYEMVLDPGFVFRSLLMMRTDGVMSTLSRDGDGGFSGHDGPLPALAGCVDIDISATPFTNTLPIRRLGLAIGEAAAPAIAFIPLESLEPIRQVQHYTRLGERLYNYRSDDGSFTADIAVDADGFVIDYPPLFVAEPVG